MSGLRILVTGSRSWQDRATIKDALLKAAEEYTPDDGAWANRDITVVHGNARGADTIAHLVAVALGWAVEPHPCTDADWAVFGKSAGHRRNGRMVSLGADVCLAFPIGESRGTRGCMELAKKAGIPVINYGEE